MNYLSLINSFWDSTTTNPLSTGQVSLCFALLHICDRNNWAEWFQAPDSVLSVLTGHSESGIEKVREELGRRGLIEFNKQEGKSGLYRLICSQ